MAGFSSDSASVLPFPGRDANRLRLAIRGLEAALEEQARAMAGFRASMSELSGAVAGLKRGTEAYHHQLGKLGSRVGEAHAAARRLEDTATLWLRTQG
ncbi:hypothetical protein GXW71_06690 [Roseomonas hellenica]|uniref:Uncharacterized protein n=1 Tax=Plastoroseomonas hellenica TaxID=2687306 RepID=A0ABS5EUR3_9PROT|nr:hypothetical protein [Plastoroseomonas hellenica]MBR0664041.1 hypothetical protein [Plastoroseomonas hellenica]